MPSRRGLWRALAASPLPLLVWLWALWSEAATLDAAGLRWTGAPRAVAGWAMMSLGTSVLVAAFWATHRPLRVLGYTLHALALSFAFGVAGVFGVVHAFGGPSGDLAAPTWALVALGASAALCVFALLATAALLVEDVRAAGESEP